MKANELMLGDWIWSPWSKERKIPVKVSALLSTGAISWEMGEENGLASKAFPIPLTSEILEKNGFERKHPESEKKAYWILRYYGCTAIARLNRGYFLFEITGAALKDGMFSRCFSGHINYVHDLQHCLKAVGITKEIVL